MMNRPARIKIVWVTIALLLGGSLVLSASAQMAGAMGNPAAANIIKIRKMTPVKERTPLYKTSVAGQAAGRAPEWWRVVVEFETSPDWIDELEFTYYAYLEDQSNKGLPVMYRGTVTYMNVAKGRHMSDMFLHPSTVVRRGLVKQIAVVVKVKGAVVAMESSAQQPNWWDRFPPVDGVLMSRDQTPFAVIDYDAYEYIRSAAPSR